jgi:hypothetical protein
MLSLPQLCNGRTGRRCRTSIQKYGTTTKLSSSTVALSFQHRGSTSSATYIDQWFESIRKPKEFYDHWASGEKIRRYLYNVDLQGRLFLEETTPKNIATSIKDEYVTKMFGGRRTRTIISKKCIDPTRTTSMSQFLASPLASIVQKAENFLTTSFPEYARAMTRNVSFW